MDVLQYEGKEYTRRNKNWVDKDHFVVCTSLQDKLNKLYFETLDISDLTLAELIKTGDQFKASDSTQLAVKCFEAAIKKAGQKEAKYILPRLTSCYRKLNQPQKVVFLLSFAKKTYGKSILDQVLMTSVAAAYCDLGEYENALKCCKYAVALGDGTISDALDLVYKRIKANLE